MKDDIWWPCLNKSRNLLYFSQELKTGHTSLLVSMRPKDLKADPVTGTACQHANRYMAKVCWDPWGRWNTGECTCSMLSRRSSAMSWCLNNDEIGLKTLPIFWCLLFTCWCFLFTCRRYNTGFGIWDLPQKSPTKAKFGTLGLNWDFFGTIFIPLWDF